MVRNLVCLGLRNVLLLGGASSGMLEGAAAGDGPLQRTVAGARAHWSRYFIALPKISQVGS
ncbi:hypothetical protein [Streptomyces sp. NPDC047990]|uniref:hypothetical protein n=1 Tax=Streptomyces sp. NPDC047990 TaxID=3365496 RepID=UPI003718055D